MGQHSIKMPRIGTNDDYVVIGSWYVKSGEKVNAGQNIASLETTKETVDFQAEFEGYLFYQHEEFDEIPVGTELAVITDDKDFRFEETVSSPLSGVVLTERARELVEKKHIDINGLDQSRVITENDIKSLLRDDFSVTRSKTNDVIIIGAGGLSKMCIDLFRLNKSYNIAGIVDKVLGSETDVMGVPVIGTDDDLPRLYRKGYRMAVIATGSISADNRSLQFNLRKKLFHKAKNAGFILPTLIHPSAQIAQTARLGEGCLVFENTAIGCDAVIGDDVIINTGAIVSHDCVVCSHARISPGAVLAGNVKVGENSLVGMGTTIYLGVKIGHDTIISNGQNIFSDVASDSVVK